MKQLLRWAQYGSLAIGLALLGYCAAVVVQANRFQAHAGEMLNRLRSREAHPGPGSAIGKLEMPRIGLSAIVVEGDDGRSLRLGVGHIPGTAWPGEAGNTGLAGHRDTFFRALQDVVLHDKLTLTTPGGIYHYEVESIRIVGPADVAVLDRTEQPALTLVTCYPFHYIGAAPRRFVIRARQIG